MNKYTRKVPFFEYSRHYLDDREKILSIIDNVASSGGFIMQGDVRAFETNLADFCGASHAVGVGNATDGLEFCWMSLGLRPGDEVICSGHTMLATASSIVTAGGVPVPVDIGWDNLIDPAAIEDAINPHTVGIMPTQLNGRICDMNAIMKIAERHGLWIIEDAAQSLGAMYHGMHSGTFGEASAFSFFPAKVLGSLGDAGAVITNRADLYDKVYQLHDHGRDVNGEVKSWGRNSRLDNIQAAILNYKLGNYSEVIKRRRKIAQIYHTRLSNCEFLRLPPKPDLDAGRFDVYQNYEITAVNRDSLKKFLAESGIGTLIQWSGFALNHFPLGLQRSLPKTDQFFRDCIMLPMNIFISDDDIHYICDTIIKYYENN